MDVWLIGLLIKGVSMVALVFAYYVVVYKGSHLLGKLFPEGKVKEFLFRERGNADASPSRKVK
jgi:hypothetical protein